MRDKKFPPAQALIIIAAVLLLFWSVFWGVIIIVAFLLPIGIAIHLGVSRHRTGWMWGLFLNWLGVLILACMRAQPTEESSPV